MADNTTAVYPGSLQIIAFPAFGAYPAFGIFTPTEPAASGYNPFTPLSLASQSAALQGLANSGLGSIQAQGGQEFGILSGLFAAWGRSQDAFMQSVSANLATVANNSARACGGFFSCLFG